ncbi:MAG: aminotransferase class III-fold pyridoxal phosphate-dependent enzyme, partial [Gemmataceae bacterium]|nr:aminotransferase class III-fold pyridoxal phosphate-dependent enzyme [Gemmataceae bacterium]
MWLFDGRQVPDIRVPPPGPKAQEWLQRDTARVSPSYTRAYPLVVQRASGCVVQDVDGNLYLDCTAGIAVTATGHCHPQVVAAIQQQAAQLIHMSGTDFYYPLQVELAERLARLVPGPTPKKVFFCNSGAEAIEGALKLARYHTGRPRVLAFLGAFHGRTYGAMSLSASKAVHRRGFAPLVPEIHHVPFPRSCPEGERCTTGCRLTEELETNLLPKLAPPEEIAAIFVEPIQGEGGYHPLPPGCLPALRQWCDRHGILLV